jgi:hypothetical protein
LRSDLPADLPAQIHHLHAHYPLVEDNCFSDFDVRLVRQGGWRRPQLCFWIGEEENPYGLFPVDNALPFLEWGLNWCVATRAHHFLMLHAGVLEKAGKVLLLPANPGSGKSTLCAALMHRNWRLMSDEFALVRWQDTAIVPFPRPVSLKNESIAVIRAFAPEAVMGPEFPKTPKGAVAHLRPLQESIARADEPAWASWIVFPKFQAGSELRLKPLSKANAFLQLTVYSFNYELCGLRGFESVSRLVDACDCYTFEYGGDLEQAVAQLNALAEGLI